MEIKCDKLEWPTVPCQSPSECGIYRGIVVSRLSLSLSAVFVPILFSTPLEGCQIK